jgi:DNA-binding GntR family transcriptional regulator
VLAIEEAIASGLLPPGAVLRQEQLGGEFGVSRTPVREALRRLEQRGLVTLMSNRSARVRTLSRDELREAFTVRAELEALAAEFAAESLTEEHAERVRRAADAGAVLAEEVASRPSPERLRELLADVARVNDSFHDAVLDASGVALLRELAHDYRRVFVGQLLKAWNSEIESLFVTTAQQHGIICALLASGSATVARAAMHSHVISSGRLMELALFGESTSLQPHLNHSSATEEPL